MERSIALNKMSTPITDTKVLLEPMSESTLETYLAVGVKSYCEHYLHLWENEDPTPYISNGLTKEVVQRELEDPNVINYLVKWEGTTVGIVKLVKDCGIDELSDRETLKAEKIYLLNEYSGKGIGKEILGQIENLALGLGKKYIWLDAMQKGKPIHFYLKNGYTIKRESEIPFSGAKPTEKPMWILTKPL